MPAKCLIKCWTETSLPGILMIGGYTSNGLGCDGLLVFPQMKQARVLSDGKTFELVLTACAQAGGGGLIGVEGGVVRWQ